jgi:hypothetical protein
MTEENNEITNEYMYGLDLREKLTHQGISPYVQNLIVGEAQSAYRYANNQSLKAVVNEISGIVKSMEKHETSDKTLAVILMRLNRRVDMINMEGAQV